MKKFTKKMKGKKVLSMLLALIMVLTVCSPAFSPLMGIIAKAASSYTVELAFENLFVFEQWASNKSSTRIASDGGGGEKDGTLTNLDVDNGSFRITNKITTSNVYTTGSMGTGETAEENKSFYMMAVEPGATYTFSCNVTGLTSGFFPYIFFYDEDYNFDLAKIVNGATGTDGDYSFNFTVPEGMPFMQVRLTLGPNSSGNAYADVKNIAIYKVDTVVDPTNLFDFDSWAANEKSSIPHGYYCDGTVTKNTEDKSITFNTNTNGDVGAIYTGFSIDTENAANNEGYYTIAVEPNTTYTFSYTIPTEGCNLGNFVPYIAEFNSSNLFTGALHGIGAINYEYSSFTFTTGANASHIQLSFSVTHSNVTWQGTIKDIALHKTTITEHKVDPTRKTYTYTTGSGATYGTLPTPNPETIPEGYIFAGWYTGEDGTGIRIASDTEIQPMSYTVYPKFEPEVDSLVVATPPDKTEYTVGEKLNTTGLILQATINNESGEEGTDSTFSITSGYYCTPKYLTATGTQTITAHYGGKTATFTVNVSAGEEKSVLVNGAAQSVNVANKEYYLNYQAPSPFNRYEMTYSSDSYVKGEISMDDGIIEEFFLEPSDNGSFASYIDSFLKGVNHYAVDSIKFTCLNKEYGNFELKSLTTISSPVPSDPTQYYENDEYKVGISLDFGGVVSYIEDLRSTGNGKVTARVYDNGDGTSKTLVDYASKLPSGHTQESSSVNLINTWDRGRYLQQSYYGTADKPYNLGNYNGIDWNYNPVQGGNIKGDASKVIDYRITDDQIYIKTRPLDWGKWSEKYGDEYVDEYITDSYMEAWYVFEDGMIKTYCRFVDFSGYPSNTTTQEMPALYTIEPLNHFVYNDVDEAWSEENLVKIEEPEFWGVLPDYYAKLEAEGKEKPNVDRVAVENWAAFTASDDADSFGIGVYSPGVQDMHFGTYPAIYNEEEVTNNNRLVENYRHAQTVDPAVEGPTSYISPIDIMTFESYKPTTYSYYITTGTAEEIYDEFKTVANKDNEAELAKSKIAVPETVYMTPVNGASTVGQYYVNNVMDENDSYNVKTEAVRDAGMYLGLHIENAKEFSVKVTNVTDPSNDIFFCNTSGSEISESTKIPFGAAGTFKDNTQYGLRFSGGGLQPGEKATAKWEITVYLEDGSTETYTAYTVMYAPGRTVGAVAEARQVDNSQNEISSWITGANGVDHSQRSPLGSFHGDYSASGYFKEDPLVYSAPLTSITSTGETANDLINVADEYSENAYVLQTATNGHDSSRSQSYLGLLTVDGSRYTNTNQIPNLKIGYDALRRGDWVKDSYNTYNTYYTLGTSESFTSTDLDALPSGWTENSNYTNFAESHELPYRETVIPSYNVSEIDGKYIHALNRAQCIQDFTLYVTRRYATAGTSVLCSVTDKSELRDAVLDGYTQIEDDPEFVEALENAATVLGDPSADQPTIDEAKKELNEALEEIEETFYALKYDNLFSALEFSQHSSSMTVVADRGTVSYGNGALTIVNDTITGGEAYTNYSSEDGYYKVDLKPDTEYVFEYDVETTLNAQAFMFFYNSSGGNGDVPTNMSIKTDNGSWNSKSESNSWWGNYTNGAGSYHYAIKFTTGANTTQASFRFGNTSNDPTTSTFSNIRLIDAAHYYTDVEGYTKTEDAYIEYASYGTLPTLSRTGYTFAGWSDANDIGITGATIATEHRTIYSQWNEHSYTIAYNANGGSGSTSHTVRYTDNVTLPADGFTKTGYKLIGWSTNSDATSAEYAPGANVSKLTENNGATITLYAVWAKSDVNVTFDNLFDYSKFNIGTGTLTINEKTGTGFTVTSTGGDANTGFSYDIPVESGKTYIFSADVSFEQTSGGYDMYVHTLDANKAGETTATPDTSNGAHREGSVYISLTGQTDNGKKYIKFTAGDNTAYIRIRFDANAVGNKLTVNNIRIWEDDGINLDTANKVVGNGNQYGTLPTPTRPGYKFNDWKNAEGQWVKESDIVNSTTTINLYSDWTEREYGIFFNTNGGSGEYEDISVTYTKDFVLPDNLTAEGAKFLGWAVGDEYAAEPDYAGGKTISVSQLEGIDADSITNITFCAVWELTDDSVSDDSVVVDFGLAVTINPFGNDADIFGYHAKEVAQSYDFGFSSDNGATLSASATGAYGNFSVNKENLVIIYTPTKTALGVEEVTLYSKLVYMDGSEKILTNTVKVVPASNVYYEETVISTGASTGKVAWNISKGISSNNPAESTGIYGYDNRYASSSQFSNNSNYNVSVDSVNKRSETASFTFTGTGFDLVAACGSNTGVQLVNVKKDGSLVKGYIVDTYYDTTEENPIVDSGLIYQTPIVNWTGDYGTYTVEITAYYLASSGALQKSSIKNNLIDTGLVMNSAQPKNASDVEAIFADAGIDDVSAEKIELVWFDDNSVLNGGTGAATVSKSSRAIDANGNLVLENYVDGIRVYNALNKDSSNYSDNEKNAVYANIVNSLVTPDAEVGGIAYISGVAAEGLTWETYQKKGPKGEIYLNSNNAITFKITVNPNEKVMIALRAVSGATKFSIGSDKTDITVTDVEIGSATEMYYDITNCIGTNGITAGTEVMVTVTNSGDEILAVNHVKFSGGDGTASNGGITPRSGSRSVGATTEVTQNRFLPLTAEDIVEAQNSLSKEAVQGVVENGVVVPVIEEEIPDDDNGNEGEIPEAPDDDSNEGEEGSSSTDGAFDIFSLFKWLIELIKNILFNTVGNAELL